MKRLPWAQRLRCWGTEGDNLVDEWLIWAAGFVDGEGCIYIPQGRQGRWYHVGLAIAQTDPQPLWGFAERWGGKVYVSKRESPRWATAYRWHVSSALAVRAIKELVPHLRVKRPQAELAIAFSRLRKGDVNRPLATLEIQERRAYYLAMKKLNATGSERHQHRAVSVTTPATRQLRLVG